MRKTALFLALVLSFAMPAAVGIGALKEPESALVFENTDTAPDDDKIYLPQEKIELIEAIVEDLPLYMTPGVSSPVTDFVFGNTESVREDEEAGEAEELPDKDTDREYDGSEADEDLDKGYVSNGTINSEKPILQEASGTIIMGYYAPSKVKLTAEERDLVERVVMHEVSDNSYIDALAVAQCIYDRILRRGQSVEEVLFEPHAFASPTYRWDPGPIVKDAVSDVFDKGYRLTKEKMYYFYAVRIASPGAFHETQKLLIETSKHRYFGPWEE